MKSHNTSHGFLHTYTVIGVMAGSSMDGLDIAEVTLQTTGSGDWRFELGPCETVQYTTAIYDALLGAPSLNQHQQKKLDQTFGQWVGQQLLSFINSNMSTAQLLAVHGHTLVHQPSKKISWQLGDGQAIATTCNTPTVTNFRDLDVQLGGQGAPLVPKGDFDLFGSYDACVNLGGIANVSLSAQHTAWDVSPCNQVLNFFAQQLGYPYDAQGSLAKQGMLHAPFLEYLESIPYFYQKPPKSLPNQYIDKQKLANVKPIDGLCTYTEFVAKTLAQNLAAYSMHNGRVLLTGGGAFNCHLVERIKAYMTGWEVIVPHEKIVSYKEALVFAYLGLLKSLDEVNVLKSVTGACRDSSSGVIHFPN